MSTAIVVGIVVLLGGIVGVFLYLRAQKRKETEEREEAERRAAIAEAEKEKAEFLRKQKAASDAEEMEKKIKAMKAESDAKIARLERSAREAEKRRMGRPRRQETPAGTKKERRNFREMLLMIATILFKPPPGISGGAPTKENIRKTKQVLATIREGTADKETVKRWKRAWKLAKIKIRERARYRPRPVRFDKGPPRRFGSFGGVRRPSPKRYIDPHHQRMLRRRKKKAKLLRMKRIARIRAAKKKAYHARKKAAMRAVGKVAKRIGRGGMMRAGGGASVPFNQMTKEQQIAWMRSRARRL